MPCWARICNKERVATLNAGHTTFKEDGLDELFADALASGIPTAEITKVVENTFRAVNIAFANELAKICRHDNMDVYEIIRICNMHPRVNILQPGPGVGGHSEIKQQMHKLQGKVILDTRKVCNLDNVNYL